MWSHLRSRRSRYSNMTNKFTSPTPWTGLQIHTGYWKLGVDDDSQQNWRAFEALSLVFSSWNTNPVVVCLSIYLRIWVLVYRRLSHKHLPPLIAVYLPMKDYILVPLAFSYLLRIIKIRSKRSHAECINEQSIFCNIGKFNNAFFGFQYNAASPKFRNCVSVDSPLSDNNRKIVSFSGLNFAIPI